MLARKPDGAATVRRAHTTRDKSIIDSSVLKSVQQRREVRTALLLCVGVASDKHCLIIPDAM